MNKEVDFRDRCGEQIYARVELEIWKDLCRSCLSTLRKNLNAKVARLGEKP